jgi:hypothetical protein
VLNLALLDSISLRWTPAPDAVATTANHSQNNSKNSDKAYAYPCDCCLAESYQSNIKEDEAGDNKTCSEKKAHSRSIKRLLSQRVIWITLSKG